MAAFGGPVTLSQAGQSAGSAQVGVDADGDAVVVWRRFNGFNFVIQARTRSATGVAGPLQEITATGQNASLPQVGVAANGDALIVWVRSDGTTSRVQARSRSAAGVLGPVQTLSPAGVNASNPRVAVAPNGRSVIMWQLADRIQARARSAAGVLSAAQTLSGTGTTVQEPCVGIADNGNAVFAWLRYNGSFNVLQVRGRSAAGTLGPVQFVSLPNTQAATPDIAVDASGDALLVWEKSLTGPTVVQARSRTAAGALGPLRTLSLTNIGTGAFYPQIGMQDDGDAIVAWRRIDSRIQVRTVSAAGGLGPISDISSSSGGDDQPQVVYDENGVAAFVWLHSTGGSSGSIQARVRSAAGTLSAIENVTTAGSMGFPEIAMANGVATAVWDREISSISRIQTAKGP
jgi:hypothetical protein